MQEGSAGDGQASEQGAAPRAAGVAGTFVVRAGDEVRRMRVTVPRAAVRFQAVLPAVRVLVDASVALATQAAERRGAPVSCRPGCCACCYYAPMLSPAEARAMAAWVDALEEPRRSEIVARFRRAMERLRESGLWQRYEDGRRLEADGTSRAGYPRWHDDYLALRIACPFLEERRCSIYDQRPLVCRDYLVRNDPEQCARVGGELDRVAVRPGVEHAAWRLGQEDAAPRSIMLVAALQWALATPESGACATGVQWLVRLKAALDAPRGVVS